MKKTAAIYVRVSTPDQHVESQLYDLRELAYSAVSRLYTNMKIVVFAERRHAVRGSMHSWRMPGERNSR